MFAFEIRVDLGKSVLALQVSLQKETRIQDGGGGVKWGWGLTETKEKFVLATG